jgi:hypothetical protein
VQIIYSQYVPLFQSRQFSNLIPLKVFCDAEVQKVFDSGKELGLQSGICTFSADVVAKIDSASPDAQNGPGVHTVAILRVPHTLSPEQYAQQIHPLIDKLTALPAAQKTFRKYDLVGRRSISVIRPTSHLTGCGE